MNLSIRTKLIFITVGILLFAIGATTFTTTYFFSKSNAGLHKSRASVIGNTLKFKLDYLLSLGLPLADIIGFEKQCMNVVNTYDDISYAMIVDPWGRILFHNDPSQHDKVLTGPEILSAVAKPEETIHVYSEDNVKYYDITIPVITKDNEHVATIRIGFPEQIITQQSKKAIAYSIVVAIVSLGLVVVLLVMPLTAWFTRPLMNLVNVIEEIRKTKTDLTKRVEVDSGDEIGRLGFVFNQMLSELDTYHHELEFKVEERTAQLKRSNSELEQFSYVASHDLQEPLRMVTSYVQLLEKRYKGKLDADADEFIGFAVDGAARMKTLISDLLTYSRVGTRGKEFQPVDCEDMIKQVLVNLQIAVEESGAAVTHDALPTVMADETQLSQLFQNLIGNAIKFNNNGSPRVHISSEEKGNEWAFSVKDDGIGIAPEYVDRIFGVFQRLHKKDEYPGTGIGLAVCKKIVERHGGSITVKSAPGKGATFIITMPVKQVKEEIYNEQFKNAFS